MSSNDKEDERGSNGGDRKKKKKRKQCSAKGCITPVQHKVGGIRGRCSKHGGIPLCSMKGCKTPVQHREGGIRGRCSKHGGIPLCSNKGCRTPAQYHSGGIQGRCSKHGGIPLCTTKGCKTPVQHREGGIRGRCSKHGGIPLCSIQGCTTPTQYRIGGLRKRCVRHGGFPKCNRCQLFSVTKVGKLCSYCDPNSKASRRSRREEEAVAEFLKKNKIRFEREVSISFKCFSDKEENSKKSARLDFVVYNRKKKIFVIEVDENQHKSSIYSISCDIRRMLDVMCAVSIGSGTPPENVIWIRFNPNAYKLNGKTTRMKKKEERLKRLVSVLQDKDDENRRKKKRKKTEKIIYMYYDSSFVPASAEEKNGNKRTKGRFLPDVTKDPNFPQSILPSISCIV